MTSLAASIRIPFIIRPVPHPFLRTALFRVQNTHRNQSRWSTTSTNNQNGVQCEGSNQGETDVEMKILKEPTPSTKKPPNSSLWNKFPSEVRQWSIIAIEQSRGIFSSVISATQTSLSIIGGKLNEVTGYERIEDLKQRVHGQGRRSIPFLLISVLINIQSNDFRPRSKRRARQKPHMNLRCRLGRLHSGT